MLTYIAAGAFACGLLSLAGCKTNVATGEKYFSTASEQQVTAMGIQAAPQLAQEFGGAVPNAQLQRYVSEVGHKLAAQTEDGFPSQPWEFTLLNSPVINAFSLPGGKVFVSRGLAEKMTNEAQMAGVLGHEIGHVTAEHVARRLGQQTLLGGALQVAGLAVQGGGEQAASVGQLLLPALNVGGQLTLLKFSRDEETQADHLGMRYMSKVGYNPTGQLQVMQILKDSGGSGGAEFLATHPLPETRIKQVQSWLNGEFRAAATNPSATFNEQRFQSEFLSVIRTLPPAPAPKASGTAQGGQLRSSKRAR